MILILTIMMIITVLRLITATEFVYKHFDHSCLRSSNQYFATFTQAHTRHNFSKLRSLSLSHTHTHTHTHTRTHAHTHTHLHTQNGTSGQQVRADLADRTDGRQWQLIIITWLNQQTSQPESRQHSTYQTINKNQHTNPLSFPPKFKVNIMCLKPPPPSTPQISFCIWK